VRSRSLFTFALSLLAASAAYAGPITGRVVDPDGRAVPGASVLLVGGAGVRDSVVSNARGEFTLRAPDAGRFEVRIAVDGFRAASLPVDGSAAARDVGALTLEISAVSESLVVSAAQVDIPLSRAQSSVTVITAAELESRQLHTVADALRTVPGLTVAANGGQGAVTSVFPRGGESNFTLVYIDGVEANVFGGGFDFAHLATANVERIEVVRGPQSALYGANAIGGIVNVITRRGGPIAAGGTVEGGSFGTSNLSASASGTRGPWDWGGSAEHLATDGQNGERTDTGAIVANDDYDRTSAAIAGGWQADDGRSLRGTFRYATDERGFPGPFGSNPAGAFEGIDQISRGTDDRWLLSAAGTLPTGQRVRSAAQFTYGRTDGDFVSQFGPSSSSSRRVTGRWQSDIAVTGMLDLSAGLEFLRERADSSFITGASGGELPVKRWIAGYFAEGRWRHVDRLFVTAGVRIDDIHRDALEADPNAFAPRPEFPSDSVVSTNPRVSAAWFVRPDAGSFTKIRGAAGTGIRPPDGFEIAFTDNPSLKPERSKSAEAGLDQAFGAGHGLLEATVFFNTYDDLIVAVGSFQGSSHFRTDNIANARARGVELAGTARGALPGWAASSAELRVGYTFLDTDVLAVDGAGSVALPFHVGDPLLRRPRHQLFGEFTVSAGRLTAFVQGNGRGRALDVEPSLGTFGGLFFSDGYQVWSAGGAWQVVPSVSLFARVNNLFDRSYEEALGFPALGRGAMVGLRIAAGR
jgi:outer membrane cobalamin receptor